MKNKAAGDSDIPTLTEVLVKGKKTERQKMDVIPDLFADASLLETPPEQTEPSPPSPKPDKKPAAKKTPMSTTQKTDSRAVTLSKKDLQECIDQVLEQHMKDVRRDLMLRLQDLLKPSSSKKPGGKK